MKKQNSPSYHFSLSNKAGLFAGLALCLPLFWVAPAACAIDQAPATFSEGQNDLKAAQNDLRMAEKDFAEAGKVVDEGTTGRTTWSQLDDPQGEQPQAGVEQNANNLKKPHPRTKARATVSSNTAPGYDGYMGTYTDPANGDIVTSVIAPTRRSQDQNYQNYPIIIEPDVSGWGNSGWNNYGWNNSGWAGNNWGYPGFGGPGQQVPGYPFPPAYPGFQPSGQVPGYPYPPSNNWPPPPPNGPNYAPSLPGQNPPPVRPNNPGGIMPPPGPGFGPGQGPAINPTPPPKPGFGPGQGPGYPPLLPPQSGPGNKPNFGPGWGNKPNFGPGHGPNFKPGFGPMSHRPNFAPGFRPGMRPVGPGMGPRPGIGPGFRPHSELTPPKNPGRPGSMPLVSPNFPPHVQHQPFVDLYKPPQMLGLTLKNQGDVTKATRHPSYFIPGSAQSWETSNWQPGKTSTRGF